MAEPKIAVVSPESLIPAPSQDEIIAAQALADEARDLDIVDFSYPGVPIEPDRKKPEWRRLMGLDKEGNDLAAPLDGLPHVPDLWSYTLTWECWRPGEGGKNQKVDQRGPLRRVDGQLPTRDELPDQDRGLWEFSTRGTGKRVDPWRKRGGLIIKNPRNSDLLYWRFGFEGFATLSRLLTLYAGGVQQHPGLMPEITFGFSKSYSFKGELQFDPALIPTGAWALFGPSQAPPPLLVSSNTSKTTPLIQKTATANVQPKKAIGERGSNTF
jgi:hypothetical protein